MELMKEMPVAAVARKVGEHDTRLWRIFHYYVERAMNNLDFSSVSRIAIDGVASGLRIYLNSYIENLCLSMVYSLKTCKQRMHFDNDPCSINFYNH
jgi:hypothetical protein